MNKNKVKFIFFIALVAVVLLLFVFKTSADGIVQTGLMDIKTNITGKIIELNLENNKQVQKGEILVQFDVDKYKKEFDEISQKLEDLNIQNDLSSKEANEISVLVEQNREDFKLAKLRLENANEDIVIYKNALKDGTVTNQDYKNALANLEVAKAQYDELQLELEENETLFDELLKRKTSEEEEIKTLSEQFKQAELNLSYATISSPVDGVVVNSNVKIGQTVNKNDVLASLVPQKCYVLAEFKTFGILKIKEGQKVEIFVEQNKFDGQVDEIVSVGDKTTTAKIIFSQDEGNKEVLSGMKAVVSIKLF